MEEHQRRTDLAEGQCRPARLWPVTQSYLLVANNGALYLRIDRAIYKSRDGGEGWVKLAAPLPGNTRAFDINRGTPTQMFHGDGAAVWKSGDESASWRATITLQTGLSPIGCIATEPSFPDGVYVCVSGAGSPNGVYTVGGKDVCKKQPDRVLSRADAMR